MDSDDDHVLLIMKMCIKLKTSMSKRNCGFKLTGQEVFNDFGKLIRPKLVELHTEEEEQVSEILHKVRIIVSVTLCTVHKTYHVYKTLDMEQHPEID